MVGQVNLQKIIFKLIETNSFPRSSILEGPFGCGKHLLVQEIGNKMNLPILDITNSIDLDTIQNIYLNPNPTIYYINTNDISIKEQNVILKLLEEPLKNVYLFLLTENKQGLLDTVINRCQIFIFEPYLKEELQEFINPEFTEYINLLDTPGQIIAIQECPVQDMVNLAIKVFTKIVQANYSNVLTIPDKLCFSKEPDGNLDFKVFTYFLIKICYQLYCNQQIPFAVYELTNNFYKDLSIANINKKHLFEHFLIELKLLMGG